MTNAYGTTVHLANDADVVRMDRLRAADIKCNVCGSKQVQLLSINLPAHWKCRKCGEMFLAEPKKR